MPSDSLHVTLAFLGQRDDADAVVSAVRDAMRPVTLLCLEDVVLLPPRRPRVMAVKLAGDMSALQSAVAEALDAVEKRPFLPHVTLARARERPSREMPVVPSVAFQAPSVSVYRSHLSPKGARYEALATFPVLTVASRAEEIRAVRLAALADAPGSFGRTLAQEEARSASWWSDLAARSAAGVVDRVFVAAEGLGMAAGHRDGEDVELWGMWVDPAARGRGLARALLRAVVEWARSIGAARVVLRVHDGVPGAASLYVSEGFVPTGRGAGETRFALELPEGLA